MSKWSDIKMYDLTIPIGICTPAWPTYEPLQRKFFKRLTPNGANGQLLTHSNRWTGFEYRNDPAVATVEIVNENSVLEGWQGWRLNGKDEEKPHTWSPIPVSYANELTALFNDWLAKNRDAAFVAKLRKEAGVGETNPVPRLAPNQFAQASRERFHAEADFLIGLERNFFAGMKRLLREELGVKPMIVGCADHNDGYAAYAHIESLAMFDREALPTPSGPINWVFRPVARA